MGWASIPFIAMSAALGLRFWTIYAMTAPRLLPDGSLRSWEQADRLYGRIKTLFYSNLFAAVCFLAISVVVNSLLPEAPFRSDVVILQVWVSAGLMVAVLLVLQVASGMRDIELGKRYPGLADSATPPMVRAMAVLTVAIPMGLLLAALANTDSPLFFPLEGLGFVLLVLRLRLYTRYLVKRRVRLAEDDPIATKTREVFEQAGVKPRDFIVTPSTVAGGYVLPSGVVAVTTALTWLLTPDEIAAVLVHELSHYRAGDLRRFQLLRFLTLIVVAGALGGVEYLLLPSIRDAVVVPGFYADLLVAIWLQALLMGAITRPIEFRCDAAAVQAGYGAEMASALEKLARFMGHPRKWSRFHHLFLTHPSYADRIARLAKPDT